MENEKKLPLSQFVIRIVALLSMTSDHVGIFMLTYLGAANPLGLALRAFGRLAFPLFIFMLAEGMLHTHNAKRYMGRLSIVLGVMIVAESIFIYGLQMEGIAGNPFIDLVLCGLVLMFLKNLEEPGKKKLYALLALLPIAYLGISLGANLFEVSNKGLIDVSWFPKYIRADYNIFGLFLALGFYYSYKVALMFGKKDAEAIGMSLEEYRESTIYRRSVNILMMLTLMVTVLVFWGISFIGMNPDTGFRPLDIYSMSYESYCLIVLPFLYFYNGERGYDSKWFRIFNYLYFPVHMVFIFAVFALIFGL